MTTNKNSKLRTYGNWFATAGLILIFIGTMIMLLKIESEWWRYIYGAGAITLIAGRLMAPYKGDIFRIKRLSRIEFWAAIFFCVAVFFMFYPGAGATDWLAFTLAGGAIQVYTSIMIPIAESRELKKRQQEKQSKK